jgi:hypothetical protein
LPGLEGVEEQAARMGSELWVVVQILLARIVEVAVVVLMVVELGRMLIQEGMGVKAEQLSMGRLEELEGLLPL